MYSIWCILIYGMRGTPAFLCTHTRLGRTKAEAVMCAIFEPIASSNASNLGYLSSACGQPAHAHRQSHSHIHIDTHTCSEEINDCDLLHLIAHKPGPSTCSNNFWLSHLSKFARMCERNRERRMNICGLQCRQSIYGRLSLTKRNVRFIKTNFNGQRHGQQPNTWLPNQAGEAGATLFTLYLIFGQLVSCKLT